jgi:hypothetical protein
MAGLGSLTLADLLRRRAEARPSPSSKANALLVVWLHGGASHLETYDPKPLAPSEYRGPYHPIATRVPGMQISELLPRHAQVAHRFTLLRSLAHTGPCHDSGPQQLFTGFPITVNRLKPNHPDLFAIVDQLRADPSRTIPNNVGVPPIPYLGAAYLGTAHEPFAVHGDPNDPNFEVPNLGLHDRQQVARLDGRRGLQQRLDRLTQQAEQLDRRDAFDAIRGQAWNVLTGPQARRAFDLSLEPDRVRDRYGRNSWGQRCLLARRLVEAGVDLVTAALNGPLCGRVNNWDDHAVNHHVFDAMKYRAPFFDQAVAAMVECCWLSAATLAARRESRMSRAAAAAWPAAPPAWSSPDATIGRTPCPSCSAAAASRKAMSSGPPTGSANIPSTGASASATSWPRSTDTWASMPSARPSATPAAGRSRCFSRTGRPSAN